MDRSACIQITLAAAVAAVVMAGGAVEREVVDSAGSAATVAAGEGAAEAVDLAEKVVDCEAT